MNTYFQSKVFLRLFLALVVTFAPFLSTGILTPVSAYAAEYPTGPSLTPDYLEDLEQGLKNWPGANIDWYLADMNAAEFNISSPAELFGMAYLVNTEIEEPRLSGWVFNVSFAGKTINLTSDIDLSTVPPSYSHTYGEAWRAMGWGGYSEPDYGPGQPGYAQFEGIFNGNGHTVSGLANESLFGFVKRATIKNLSTSGTLTTGIAIPTHLIAGVVNQAKDSTFINLKSDVNLINGAPNAQTIGGIVGEVFGNTIITGCEFSGMVSTTTDGWSSVANAPLGGIVGQIGNSLYGASVTISDSVNYADLTGQFNVGGIAGATQYGATSPDRVQSISLVIENSANHGNISVDLNNAGDRFGVGGLLGAAWYNNASIPQSVTIDRSANYGKVTGTINAGGLVGTDWQGSQLSITNSFNQGDVTSTRVAGGIVGRIVNADGAVIRNTYNKGTVSGDTSSGGFIGVINDGIVNSTNNYYLETSAPAAVNNTLPYDGVTALTDEQMKDPSFVGMLGDGYVTGADGYPVLNGLDGLNGLGVYYNDGTIVVKKAERLAVATLWFTADSGKPQFTGSNSFSVLDTAVDGSRYRVTLGYLVAGGTGFTSDNAAIASISGATGVKLVNARFSGYDANGKAIDISYHVEKGSGGGFVNPGDDDPPIVDPIVKYDLNNDGVVDQLDLTIALSYFTVNGGDANWNSAKIADFNNDGIVDIEDFILLLNHMVW